MGSFICFGIFVMVCQPLAQGTTATVINSFCQAYHRILRTSEEGAALAHAPLAVRQRIAANETLYRCHCEGWQNPICHNETMMGMR